MQFKGQTPRSKDRQVPFIVINSKISSSSNLKIIVLVRVVDDDDELSYSLS